MTCINCFFYPANQLKIKNSIDKELPFEQQLELYKKLYIKGINELEETKKCLCKENNLYSDFNDEEMNLYNGHTNGYMSLIKNNIFVIQEFFDLLIDTYFLFLKKSYKHSVEQLWTIINLFNLYESENFYFGQEKIVFRGRNKAEITDLSDKYSYFHMPFNLRYKIRNERFSISGQPMLYLANSLITVTKELNRNIDELSVAAFLIRSKTLKKIAVIKNPIYEAIYRNIPAVIGAGSKYEYKDELKNHILSIIRKAIFYEILTFPKKQKNDANFIEEYIFPQMFTTLMIENNFNGISFPSTKDYSNILNVKKFCDYNQNLALFVNYNNSSNYDEDLFSEMPCFIESDLDNIDYKIEDFYSEFERLKDLNRKTIGSNKLISLSKASMYIDDMKNSTIDGVKYFDTKMGKLELKFFHKFNEYLYKELLNDIKQQN